MYGNLTVFQEPRGVMRILHFIFSICAFATISGYAGYIIFSCPGQPDQKYNFDYPYQFYQEINLKVANTTCKVPVNSDSSSDAKFFVATGVLGMLYSLAILIVYVKFDEMYKSNNQLPLIDFIATVIFGVLWLSSSAAWANGLTGLKSATSPDIPGPCGSRCGSVQGSFSTLNISVIFGFLNFFLWTADLWFLYKETAWFQGPLAQTESSGV